MAVRPREGSEDAISKENPSIRNMKSDNQRNITVNASCARSHVVTVLHSGTLSNSSRERLDVIAKDLDRLERDCVI